MFKTLFLCFVASASMASNISSPFQPSVSINTNGNVVVSWSTLFKENYVIKQATLVPGESWKMPTIVSIGTKNAYFPMAAINDQDRVFYLWQSYNGSFFEIHSATALFGDTPTRNFLLSSCESSNPEIDIDENGNAVGLWQEASRSGYCVSGAIYTHHIGWERLGCVSSSEFITNADVSVFPLSGSAVAVWQGSNRGTMIIQAATLPLGKTWDEAVTISTPGMEVGNPQVVCSYLEEALVGWQAVIDHQKVIQLTSHQNGSWAVPFTISIPGSDLYNAKIAFDSTGHWAALVGKACQGMKSFIFSALRDQYGHWSPGTIISGSDQNCSAPSIVINRDGQAVAIWVNSDGTRGTIHAATLSAGTWSEPCALSSSDLNSGTPVLDMNDAGYVVAVWQAEDGSTPFFQATTRSKVDDAWSNPITISNAATDSD